ncbi:MAG: DUF3854 domain-containing protein [Merismopedia sp. SIO2A8]|nr:DUF3854 domain-containing protein [Symploca sp. SIO2B6]NET47347.1 DUF3854 domain-containing protein [Merismopedia sp. SIO2A8]
MSTTSYHQQPQASVADAKSAQTLNSPEHNGLSNKAPQIKPEHFREWTKGSGVSCEITQNAIASVEDQIQIASFLSWKAYLGSPGYLILGYDLKSQNILPQQFKPNIPVEFPGEKGKTRTAKYLTSKERPGASPYDAILLPGSDWEEIAADTSIRLALTEGGKKAGALKACGYEAIGLCGVDMWHIKDKTTFVPNLKAISWKARDATICFDSDMYQKPGVFLALKRLGKKLARSKAQVLVATWDPELGKGIDDVLAAHGKEKVTDIMEGAEPLQAFIAKLEKQWTGPDLSSGNKKTEKPPTPRALADHLYEKFRQKWAYDLQSGTWRTWDGTIWEKQHEKVMLSLLKAQIQQQNIHYKTERYTKDTLESLSLTLLRKNWQSFDKAQWIAGSNGVLSLNTGKVEPHQPSFGFTSVLPHQVAAFELISDNIKLLERLKTECPLTYEFFEHASGGNAKKILKLLAVVAGVVRFRFKDLQKFVHLIGEPGTGKGTFFRLLQDIVGKGNYEAASLTNLKDGNVMARILDAQLAVFPDERKSVGVEHILKLVGGDSIDFRKVFTPGGSKPFEGSLVIGSNSPIFVGDTQGIDRRLCLIPFDQKVKKKDKGLNKKLEAEIPQLVSAALSMPLELVDNLIDGVEEAENTRWHEWLMKVESCKVAGFVDSALVADPEAGVSAKVLFETYLEWSRQHNHSSPGSSTFFGSRLKQHLSWLELDWKLKKTNGRKIYRGFKIRESVDDSPLIQDMLNDARDSSTVPEGQSRDSSGTVENPYPVRDRDSRDSLNLINCQKNECDNNTSSSQCSPQPQIPPPEQPENPVEKLQTSQSNLQEEEKNLLENKAAPPETVPTVPIPCPEPDTTVPSTVPRDSSTIPSTVPEQKPGGKFKAGDDVVSVAPGELQNREGTVQSVYKDGVVRVSFNANPTNQGYKRIYLDCLPSTLVLKKEKLAAEAERSQEDLDLGILAGWLSNCSTWADVEDAASCYPHLKKKVWEILPEAEKVRLQKLKPQQ